MTRADAEALRAPVECVVKVDDQEITDLYPYLMSVEVRMKRGEASTCALKLDTRRDERGQWLIEDSEVFIPWKKIVIEAHFGRESEEVLRGYIRDVKSDHPQDMSASSVTVSGQDESILLDREHVRRVWSREDEQLSDGQIASEIARRHGLTPEVEDGLHNAGLNQDGTDIDFVKRRAQANGYELFVRQGTLHFGGPQLEGEPQPTIMVYAGVTTNCLSFQTSFDGHKPDRVKVVRATTAGVDQETEVFTPNLPLLGRTAANSESMGLPPFEWSMNQPSGSTRAEADARAQATANAHAWKIEASGELDGPLYRHVLLTHQTVDVDGVGTVDGGRYYVSEVTHTFSLNGYRQRFKALRNATGML